MIRKLLGAAAAALLLVSSFAHAEVPWTFSNNTRYLAMGDSLAAGYGAIPVTQGYAYLLYQEGTFGAVTNTIFANAAVPGVTSAEVTGTSGAAGDDFLSAAGAALCDDLGRRKRPPQDPG